MQKKKHQKNKWKRSLVIHTLVREVDGDGGRHFGWIRVRVAIVLDLGVAAMRCGGRSTPLCRRGAMLDGVRVNQCHSRQPCLSLRVGRTKSRAVSTWPRPWKPRSALWLQGSKFQRRAAPQQLHCSVTVPRRFSNVRCRISSGSAAALPVSCRVLVRTVCGLWL